jgi:hypothetical protein
MAAPAAGYSKATYGVALAHAKKFPFVSVRGLSARAGVTGSQAEAILARLSSDGVLGSVQNTRPGAGHAVSKVFENQTLVPMRMSSRAAAPKAKRWARTTQTTHADIDLMMAHLRDLCTSRGMTLSPRCYTGAFA